MIQGVTTYAGYTGIQTARVRNEYNKGLLKLKPTDGKGRSQLKFNMRKKTPPITREMAEKMRPSKTEHTRITGTANKSNPKVNAKVKNFGKFGKSNIAFTVAIGTYNVATSEEDKGEAVQKEVGAISGALLGGKMGAEAGAIGGWPGALTGGIVGSIFGAFTGEALMTPIDPVPVNNYDESGNYIVPADETKLETPKQPIID